MSDLDSQYIENKNQERTVDRNDVWSQMLKTNSWEAPSMEPVGSKPIGEIGVEQTLPKKPSIIGDLLRGAWEGTKALPETAATLATGMAAWPISLVGGIGMTMAKGAEEGKAFEQFLQEHYTYRPKQAAAQVQVAPIGKVMELAMKPAQWIGEVAGKLGATPEGQFYITKAGEVATLMLLPKVGKTIKEGIRGKPSAPTVAEIALDKTWVEAEAKRTGRAPGDIAAEIQRKQMAGEAAKIENAKVMEDLNARAHEEVQSVLDQIPKEEWDKYTETGKAVDTTELANLVEDHAKRMEEAGKDVPNLPQVYKDLIAKEIDELKVRVENLKELAKKADQAGAELIVVPEVLTPREALKHPDVPRETPKLPMELTPTQKLQQTIALKDTETGQIYTGEGKTHSQLIEENKLQGRVAEEKLKSGWQVEGKFYDSPRAALDAIEKEAPKPLMEPGKGEGVSRSLGAMARDLNIMLGEKGAIGDLGSLSPERQMAYLRLKADFSIIARNAKRTGKTIENYLLDLGIDKETVALLSREFQSTTKEQQKEPGKVGVPPAQPVTFGPPPDPEALRVNLGRIAATEDVKNIIAEINMRQQEIGRIEETTRGVRKHAQTISASLTGKGRVTVEDLLSRKPGEIWNAEKMTAARDIRDAAAVKVRDLTDKALAGDAEAAGNLQTVLALFGEIEAQRTGASAEVGRALESHKILSEASRVVYDPKQLGELAQAVKNSTGDPILLARRIKALQKPEQVQTFARQLVNGLKKATDIFNFAWINGLLSGPPTHIVNFASNAATFMGGVTERGISGATGQAGRLIGREAGVQMGEAGQMVYGAIAGFLDALKTSKTAWMENEPQFGARKTEIVKNPLSQEYLGTTGSFGRALEFLGNIIGSPGRAMMTADEFWKGINYRAELQARAFREAKLEGLSGKEFGDRVNYIVDHADEFEVIDKAAQDFANYQTFNNELGKVGKAIQSIANATPFTKLLMPFVRTPTDILKYTWERTPGLNMISSRFWGDISKGGAEAELALGKMALGTMAVGAVMALADSGLITGSGPHDKKLKKVWMEDGKQPYSVKIGDKWIAFDRMDPWGNVLGIAADTINMIQDLDLETGYQMFSAAAVALANLFVNKTYLKGISDFITAIKEPEMGAEKYVQNWARSLAPSIGRVINRAFFDDTIREVNGIVDAVKAGIPGFSKDLPPKRGFWGQEIIPEGSLGPDILSPYRVRTEKEDPVNKEILDNRISLNMPPRQLGGSRPSENPLATEREGWGVKLDPEEYDRFVELARKETKIGGLILHEKLSDLIQSRSYQNQSDGPDGGKALLIQSYISAYQEKAEYELRKEFPDLDERIKARQKEKAEALRPGYSPPAKGGGGFLNLFR